MGEVIPKKRRPGHDRTVKFSGPLTVAAAKRLAAELRRLTQISPTPIALSIRSGGGEVEAFYQLAGVMENLRVRGKRCKVFTIAHHARSAATYLLLSGHRAFAEANAQLGLHGVRAIPPKSRKSFTRETALALAMRLDRENRSVARTLAKHVIFRLAARHGELRSARARPSTETPLAGLEKLTRQLTRRLVSADAKRLLNEAFERLRLIFALSSSFPTQIRPAASHRLAESEAEVFHAAIAHELASHREKKWRLDATAGAELLMDYLLAKDFLPGDHLKLARRMAKKFGRNFLSRAEAKKHARLQKQNSARAEAFLIKTTLPQALGLWYFALTLCHRLLAGEDDFSAQDAYWLGLIDEVLPTERPPPATRA